jgi:putative transposase
VARWCEDAAPLREVPAEQLRWMLMADVERTVNKDGVHFERVRFIGLVGERVQVRYTPHDLRQIEIFRGDTWLCTAYPQDQLTAEQRAAVLARRHADAAELGRRQRRRQPPGPGAAGPDHRARAWGGHHRDHHRAGPAGAPRPRRRWA